MNESQNNEVKIKMIEEEYPSIEEENDEIDEFLRITVPFRFEKEKDLMLGIHKTQH